MAVNGIGATSLQDVTMPVVQRTQSPDLTQQDFLKIMIEQLKGQNPLDSGQDPNAFFQQMVQFQMLDSMNAMKAAMSKLSQTSDIANASAMIGKTVTAMVSHPADPDTGFPQPDSITTGVVSRVTFGSSGTILGLDNGLSVDAAKVAVVE